MESKAKNRYTVSIAGIKLTLLSDEPQETVNSIAKQLDTRMSEMMKANIRISNLDAAMLCSIDYLSLLLKSAKYCRDCEAKINVQENTIERLRTELEEVKAQLRERENAGSTDTADISGGEDEAPEEDMKRIAELLRGGTFETTAEDKVRTLEEYVDNKNGENDAPQTRSEKIKYIESLLRGN